MDSTLLIGIGVVVVVGALIAFIFKRNRPDPSLSTTSTPSPSAASAPPRPAATGAKRNWLLGTGGEVQGKNFHIGSRNVTLGRGIGNFIQITDADASRVHCTFKPVPYGLEVADKGSSNGTYINDQRIQGVHVMKDGDTLRIGECTFTFKSEGDFGQNAGLERKNADSRAMKQTAMGSANLQDVLKEALTRHGGNVEAASAELGVSKEILETVLAKQLNKDD